MVVGQPIQVLLDNPFWRIALSGFAGGRLAVAIESEEQVAQLVGLASFLDLFDAVDVFFIGDLPVPIRADLVDLYSRSTERTPTYQSTANSAQQLRKRPEVFSPRGAVIGGWLRSVGVSFVGGAGLHDLGAHVHPTDIFDSSEGGQPRPGENWSNVVIVDNTDSETTKELRDSACENGRQSGAGIVVIDQEPIERIATGVDLLLDIDSLSKTSVDTTTVCPVGYRRVEGGRLALVGSLVAGRDGVDELVGFVNGLAETPGVDVFGWVDGVDLADGVGVFEGDFDAGVVEHLRPYAGVIDHRSLHESPAARTEVLMGLAAAGVPTVVLDQDDGLLRLAGEDLTGVLSETDWTVLQDPELRDQLSVRLRRIGLSQGSQVTKWREIASSLDLNAPPLPTVSVILATNRPDFLEHALGHVRSQTYPEVELVLILHGDRFTRSDKELQDLYKRPLTIVRVPAKVLFGEALNRGVAVSSGTLIAKMDDDDWYAPEHIWDLVHAMDYSGADLVGKAAEFVYLQELDITIRRMVNGSETYGNRNLAGGTFLIKRHTLNTIGGWRRIPRHIDQALLDDVENHGVAWFRTFGFGYILHRRRSGHTWDAGIDYFLDQSESQSRGLDLDRALIQGE